MTQYVFLIPLLPLIGFLINGLFRNYLIKSISGWVGTGFMLCSFILSVMLFQHVNQPEFQPEVIFYFDFIRAGGLYIPFSFLVDQLSVLFLLIITGIGTLIHLYSTAYMHEETKDHFARYFAYLNLFVFSMLLLVLGANYVIMFIGWEGVGLCSYLLIGFWFGNPAYNKAAKKAFVMNRIGDLGFLLAIFWMITHFDSVRYLDVFAKAPGAPVAVVTGITLLLFVGAMGKSAQIPLYTWLPDAMAGPTPVSALIHAATMVTAGIYMIARSNILYSMAPVTENTVAVIGLATALLAATIALKQNDIKKVLAYSTVSQLGLMFLALGVGAYTAGVFHVMTHAFFKALLFLAAGSVIHAMHHEQDITKMGGLRKKLPLTHLSFLIGCLAIAGIPPFSGFFSKDEILTAAHDRSPILYGLSIVASLMTAFYMFRLYFLTFSGTFRGTEKQHSHLHESPAAMTIPLMVLAALSIAGGWIGIPEVFAHDAHWLASFLEPVVPIFKPHHQAISHQMELMLMGGIVVLIIAMIFWAYRLFAKSDVSFSEPDGISKWMADKWYVDEIYDAILVKPLNAISSWLSKIMEAKWIDGAVNGVGKFVLFGGRQIRLLQSGQVGSYILVMVISILAFLLYQLFWKP